MEKPVGQAKVAQKCITVALAGNPNSGKTTIFNALTGARQHVGNYPGVTVEKKEGRLRHGNYEITFVDLPGTYSLTAYTIEELVARNFIIDERPDAVVDIVDASNLERNLYLATQFMELGVTLILAFNMNDVAEARGFEIDTDLLSRLLGVTIVRTVGHKGTGINELKDAIVRAVQDEPARRPTRVSYGDEIEHELAGLAALLNAESGLTEDLDTRWLAVKLLEKDHEVTEKVKRKASDSAAILSAAEMAAQRIERHFGDAPEIVIADRRYGFISGACQEAVKTTVASRHGMSDRIDSVVTNRVLGIPIFLGLMYLVFKLVFTVSAPPMDWINSFFDWLGNSVGALQPESRVGSAVQSLIVNGIIGGVGGVLVFLPNITLLFLAIAVLEDSGYMARAAFIMDRLMHKIGLHGKSFIPMLIGFGCNVPAILATRTLETKRDRLTTMLVLPLMSCSARLVIYSMLIPAFFPRVWQARVLWILYIIGIVLSVLLAKLLRSTLFKGEAAPFVMELPPYRMPTLRGTLIHMWERAWFFVRKCATIIVGISILLWVLANYPKPAESRLQGLSAERAANVSLSYSAAGRVGHALEPVMKPIGFDWKTTTALIGAFAAKEVFVAQLGIVHSLGEVEAGKGGSGKADNKSQTLREMLRREYTPLQGFCILLFCLLSAPCMMTITATWKESGSWKWAALQLFGLTALAYVITFAVYQAGHLLGFGTA
jgi:ferrous iron transport protein B